jgi:small subunit ribosomal protein S6
MYETTVIINPTLEEHQIENIVKSIEEMITKNGGTVKLVERWGRKRLSYPINKRNNGYYAYFEFETEGTIVADLERNFEYDDNILRYLTIRLDTRMIKAKEEQKLKPKENDAVSEVEDIDIVNSEEEKEKTPAAERGKE